MSEAPLWERRFRAPKLTLPHWSRAAPDRVVYETNEGGVWQVHRLDVATGERRQVSDHPVGVLQGFASADGAEVVFWQEDTGDETGRWLASPWEGGGAEPLWEGVPVGWAEGLALGPGISVAGISDRDGFGIYVSVDGASATRIARSTEWLGLAGGYGGSSDLAALSADGSLLALQHAEHGDLTHPSLRVVDPRSGAVVRERGDGSSAIVANAWSPIRGDRRLAVSHEPADRLTAAIWNLADGVWTDLDHGLGGDVEPVDWWPDGGSLLLRQLLDGRHRLFRFDVTIGAISPVETPPGAIDDARVRPDGSVWFRHTDGASSARIWSDDGEEVLAPSERAPGGRPFSDWRYENDRGQEVQGWIVEPDGPGPHPLMVLVHGGPHWLYEDRYMPEVQAYVDAGFLVAMPNYRGSTGYGRAWRDALTGHVGFADVDDVTAGLRNVRMRDDVDPTRTVIAGWSWGGYVTLMQLGRNPDLWTAGIAGVPVGDYVMAYRDEAPSLQAMDRAIMGGSPEERPEVYERGNPIAYAEHVRAPVMFVIGEHDSRCPPAQAFAYVDAIADRGVDHETYVYATGHGSNDADEEVRQHRAIDGFLRAWVPGLDPIG